MSLDSLARRHALETLKPDMRAKAALSQPSAPSDVFEALARYLPTETITLFLGMLAASGKIPPLFLGKTALYMPWLLYGAFAIITPATYLALSYAKQREAERQAGTEPRLFKPRAWPVFATTIAFLVWALSIKGLLLDADMSVWGGLIGIAAILVSSLLSLGDRVLNPKPAP